MKPTRKSMANAIISATVKKLLRHLPICNRRNPMLRRTRFSIGDMVNLLGIKQAYSQRLLAARVGNFWMDSRKLQPGDVFIALESDRNDGHAYVESALEAGAQIALVKKSKLSRYHRRMHRRLLPVTEPLKAVHKVAAAYRKKLNIPLIGITGSNGKTTTRNFAARVLKTHMPLGETWSNWNNHIGVPLSLLRFTGAERAGIIEMGANHPGEIHQLTMTTRPDIAVLTNIGYAHVGLFGSLKKTADAKLEITDGLRKDGRLLINGDDPRLASPARQYRFATHSFGFGKKCTLRAVDYRVIDNSSLSFTVDDFTYRMNLVGRHFVYCALPALYLGRHFGMSEGAIAHALLSLQPVALRGTIEQTSDVTFIVDCYNANPSSMRSALELLCDIAPESKRAAIVGDMLELGGYAGKLHFALGKQLANAHCKPIIAVGNYARRIAEGALNAGASAGSVIAVESADEAAKQAHQTVSAGKTVLLKGSRGLQLENVFRLFQQLDITND
ncbi:MAG: UDP-N-acetylmuramoyl-tripeptide--D-alanyl-D-alanine ligase [Chitinivibrionales bacterium]|nr:UDP-N-acetylmuramoyl-tripeptide--D-alanyl-D-alanine ligase [Chitinivibrionales bacterium]